MLNKTELNKVENIINKQGGFREKSIFKGGCTFRKTETWNAEHKVIDLISIHEDEDGHRDKCAVDIQTGKISG